MTTRRIDPAVHDRLVDDYAAAEERAVRAERELAEARRRIAELIGQLGEAKDGLDIMSVEAERRANAALERGVRLGIEAAADDCVEGARIAWKAGDIRYSDALTEQAQRIRERPIAAIIAAARERETAREHDEGCDAMQPGPQLGPPTKPCNCHGRSTQPRAEAVADDVPPDDDEPSAGDVVVWPALPKYPEGT
jgi:hypothetical protein